MTYGPKRPSLTTSDLPVPGSGPSSLRGGFGAPRPRRSFGRESTSSASLTVSVRSCSSLSSERVSGPFFTNGPYLKKGTDSRSLQTEDQLFTITLDEALAIYAQPKQRGRAAAKPPLKELGTDPVSEKPVVVKDGRFGPYVTDGETNATLRSGDSVEEITPERGYELLAEKRAKAPAKKTAKKAPAKKAAPAKKTAAKKTVAKKTAAKKTTATKSTTTKSAATKTAATRATAATKAASANAAASED